MDKATKIYIIVLLLIPVLLVHGEDILYGLLHPAEALEDTWKERLYWFNAAVEFYHKDWRFVALMWFAAFCFFMAIVTSVRLLIIRWRNGRKLRSSQGGVPMDTNRWIEK